LDLNHRKVTVEFV